MDRSALELKILAELAELRREVREIRDRLPERAAGDTERRRELLEAIQGEDEFTAAGLMMRMVKSGEDALCAAVLKITGQPVGGVNRLARFLSRNSGWRAGGRYLERVRRDSSGTVYRVRSA